MRSLWLLLLRLLVLAVGCVRASATRAPAAEVTAREVAVVGAESALGYASAIALGRENAVAVHNTHSLTSLQLVRILHLRELGFKTLAVDFTDYNHLDYFKTGVLTKQVVLFADVGDETTLEYLLAVKRGLQMMMENANGGPLARRMSVECFATDMRSLGGYCRPAPVVQSAVPAAPQPDCYVSGTCESITLARWRIQLAQSLSIPAEAQVFSFDTDRNNASQLPSSLQAMLQRFPAGCNIDASKCEPHLIEYMATDHAEVSFTGSLAMEHRYKYAQPSAGFFQLPCGMLGRTPFDLVGLDSLAAHCEVVVITAIFGGTDLLVNPFPGQASNNTCHFAFLDASSASAHKREIATAALRQHSDTMWIGKAGVWNLIVLHPYQKLQFPFFNPRRTSRIPKMLPHRIFPNAEYIIWMDGNKAAKTPVQQFLGSTLQQRNYSIAFPAHDYRRSSHGESVVTQQWNLEHPRTASVQDAVYDLDYENYRTDFILWGGIIVRDNRDLKVHWHSCLWFNEWARYSQRDQVSLIPTLTLSKLQNRTHEFPRPWVSKYGHKKRHGS